MVQTSSAFEVDMGDSQLRYYGAAIETDDAFVYVAIPSNELFGDRVLISLSTTSVSMLCLALMCLLLSMERPGNEDERAGAKSVRQRKAAGKRARMVDVVMPDGTIKKTESAFSRWRPFWPRSCLSTERGKSLPAGPTSVCPQTKLADGRRME